MKIPLGNCIFVMVMVVLAEDEDVQPEKVACRERERLITSFKGDEFSVVDTVLGEKLFLECRFCNENDDELHPKNWFKVDRLGIDEPREVEIGMKNDNKLNRIQINKEHSLIIQNFTESDVGLYKCEKLDIESDKDKLNYLVDLIFKENQTNIETAFRTRNLIYRKPSSTIAAVLTGDWGCFANGASGTLATTCQHVAVVVTGNITAWAKYHDDYLAPINNLFIQSEGKDFTYIRNVLQLNMELISHWSSWSSCEVCGRPKGEGISKKTGVCMVKITLMNEFMTSSNPDETYILQANAISCKSQRLSRLFPYISQSVRVIPNFIQEQKCEGTCNPDAEGTNRGWKVGKSKGFKYKHHIVLREHSHATLICPESTIENEVTWRKNGKKLEKGSDTDPHIVVDTFNTLYLIEARYSDTGNYTCQVDDIKMQQTKVFVYSKSRLLTSELLRYMTYLGFVLFLSSFCYCGGLVITWHRRGTFKTYEELKEENPENEEDNFV